MSVRAVTFLPVELLSSNFQQSFIMRIWRRQIKNLVKRSKGTSSTRKKKEEKKKSLLLCAKFQFFPWYVFRDTKVQSFSVFSTWLPHYVTYDVIIIIKAFYLSSRTNSENFVSIRQAVAEKNKHSHSVRTNKQTNGRNQLS